MDVASVESGFALTRFIVGGLLAWAAVSVAFGPELVRTLVRLRVERNATDLVAPAESTLPQAAAARDR
jgi:hypothetical protein